MNQNFYFLRQLSQALAPQIVGLQLMECFSQERDELVIVLAQGRGKHNFYRPFFIRVSLRPDFTCLNFPESFNRARQNSVDLFEPLLGRTITKVQQFDNERAFAMVFEDGFTFVFKLFGNRSNVVLFQNEQVIDIFHSKFANDNQLTLTQLDRQIDQSYTAFEQADGDYRKLFPTFGKEVSAYLEALLASTFAPQQRWSVIRDTLQKLEHPTFYLTHWNYQLTLSLLPIGQVQAQYQDPIEAINFFYNNFLRTNVLDKEKSDVLRLICKKSQRTQTYIDDTLQKLQRIDAGASNEEIGHILMANLHQIADRAEQVELFDFYRDKNITIRLKAELSPQKNAEQYYRKAKNERIEIDKLHENIGLREQEVITLTRHQATIEAIETVRELRKYLKNNTIINDSVAQTPAQLFKQIEYEGFVILIGKNAKNNDLLTKHHAYKEDLWLHARDVPGSHVVLKYKSGQRFPNKVIERAAQLAAWNSKRRHDSLCPVIAVPKKYVRKPKGLPDGEVVLDKEEVILVEPMA